MSGILSLFRASQLLGEPINGLFPCTDDSNAKFFFVVLPGIHKIINQIYPEG